MDILKVRHFIFCREIERVGSEVELDHVIFTAHDIYERIIAPEYPCSVDLVAVIGIYFMQPGRDYVTQVVAKQNNEILGEWDFKPIHLETTDEVVIFGIKADSFVIPTIGVIEFEIIIDDCQH